MLLGRSLNEIPQDGTLIAAFFRACQGLVAVSNLNQACLNFVEWDWDAKTRDSLVVYGVVQRT